MDKALRVGLIGTGRIGQLHGRNLHRLIDSIELKAITDIQPETAESFGKELSVPVYKDYHDILKDDQIDAVIICSSTDTHAPFIEESANAKKHIFCEKPIDFDLDKIRKALKAVKDNGVKLMVGFNRRFDPHFFNTAERIKKGDIGVPHIIRITSRDPGPPPIEYIKVSGGIFLDMTIHDFDMARYLMNNEDVIEIFATGNTLVDPEIGKAGDIDTAIITMKYKSGAFCIIDNSRQAVYGYDQRIEAFGTKGSLNVPNTFSHHTTLWNEKGIAQEPPHFFFLERYQDSYINEMHQFATSILENKELPVDGVDGLKATELGLAAKRSFQEKKPISLE